MNLENQNKEQQITNAKMPEHPSFDNTDESEKCKTKTFTVLGLNIRSLDYHTIELRVLRNLGQKT